MNDYFVFDNVDSRSFGKTSVFFNDIDAGAPLVYDSIEIPGRNGALLMNRGYRSNVKHSYDVIFYGDNTKTVNDYVRSFRDKLLSKAGYFRLYDSFKTDEEYQACIHPDEFEVQEHMSRKCAIVRVEFDRKPQRFARNAFVNYQTYNKPQSGNFAFSINSLGWCGSKPVFIIYGNGVLTVNDVMVSINTRNPYITLDCDMQDAYYDQINCNQDIILQNNKFPEFRAGINNISITGNITQIRVQPRWYRL